MWSSFLQILAIICEPSHEASYFLFAYNVLFKELKNNFADERIDILQKFPRNVLEIKLKNENIIVECSKIMKKGLEGKIVTPEQKMFLKIFYGFYIHEALLKWNVIISNELLVPLVSQQNSDLVWLGFITKTAPPHMLNFSDQRSNEIYYENFVDPTVDCGVSSLYLELLTALTKMNSMQFLFLEFVNCAKTKNVDVMWCLLGFAKCIDAARKSLVNPALVIIVITSCNIDKNALRFGKIFGIPIYVLDDKENFPAQIASLSYMVKNAPSLCNNILFYEGDPII
jgi:hypothetical protein